MLVLTRKPGEKIKIGENVFVEVLETTRSGVRLGFTAPREVPIMRTELLTAGDRPAAETD